MHIGKNILKLSTLINIISAIAHNSRNESLLYYQFSFGLFLIIIKVENFGGNILILLQNNSKNYQGLK